LNSTFFYILIVATVTQGTILVFALLTSKHSNKTANYLLSGLIVLFSYYALVKTLSNTNEILHYPHLIRTYRPIFILACSVIFFYCKALTFPGFRFTYLDSLHLIPFGIYTLVMLPFFFSDSAIKNCNSIFTAIYNVMDYRAKFLDYCLFFLFWLLLQNNLSPSAVH